MGKKGLILLVLILFLLPAVLADTTLDAEIQRVTHYAEEYETGNIDYVQFLVYTSSVRENINELLGAVERHHGGLLEEEQLRAALGEPTHETKWVWVEKEEHEKKLDYSVPRWEKIIFDGKKIQIRLEVHPSLFTKGYWDDQEQEWIETGEEFLIYRLHFNIEFKRDVGDIDFEAKISEIQSLAEAYNADPSGANAEILAKESVNAERLFENYFRQGGGECLATMYDIIGEENSRGTQKLMVQEIEFYSGDDFEAITRLEMCDDCEWNWIGLNMWLEGRGPNFRSPKDVRDPDEYRSRERYKTMTSEGLKAETIELIGEIKRFLSERDLGPAMAYSSRLNMLTEAWNQLANDVWEEIDLIFEQRRQAMTDEERRAFDEDYGWIKQDQERRQVEREKRVENYQERKDFYISLFAPYDKKEFYFEQIEFEKRLIQEFKVRGEEICNNNVDDNDNGQVDCQEDQCGGQFCGRATTTLVEGNQTIEKEVSMYCIAGTCKAKEEPDKVKVDVCGNHMCEANETIENCAEDCSVCPVYDAIECAGKVIFSGNDENGCPLPPICIEEDAWCDLDEDCPKPLCGVSECVREDSEDEMGTCQMVELATCGTADCVDGEERRVQCPTGEEIIVKICSNGLWERTGVTCRGEDEDLNCVSCGNSCMPMEDVMAASCLEPTENFECIQRGSSCIVFQIEEPEEPVVGNKCSTRADCGGENDVCSNGKCVEIPEVVHVDEPKEPPKMPPEQPEEEEEEQPPEEQQESQEPEQPEEPPEQPPEEPPNEGEGGATEPVALILGLLDKIKFRTIGLVTAQEDKTNNIVNGEGGDKIDSDNNNAGDAGGNDVIDAGPGDKGPGPGPEDGAGGGGEECHEECWEVCDGEECREECFEKEFCEDVCSTDDEGKEVCEPVCETKQVCEQVCEGGECYEECGEVCGPDGKLEDDWEDDEGRWDEDCGEMCERECFDAKVRPCTDRCIRDACGEQMDCDVDAESKTCEETCKEEKDLDECAGRCEKQCEAGEYEGMEHEWEEEEWQEEKGVFAVGGSCRTVQGKKEGFIWFNGWGEPFEDIQPLKHKYYMGGEADWCKWDLENLKQQRLEFEQGFNQEFVEWFFEKYMTNTAEDWEQHASGIFELYWRNIDTLMQTAHRMQCLEMAEMPEEYTPIELISYNTDYGSVEYWEEVKMVRMPGMEEEIMMITPYMKIWIFPPEGFIRHELSKSMETGEFPGSPEEKMERGNEEGPTEEEKRMLKQDRKFMNTIKTIADKYGGSVDAAIQFIDYEADEIVFNLYVQVNEEDIMKIKPMLPEEVPAEDVRVRIDYDKLYEIIYFAEKQMGGGHIESPPWERRGIKPIEKVKEIRDGIRIFFKIRDMINSAEYIPADAEADAKKLFKTFFSMMLKQGMGEKGPGEEDERHEDVEELEGELFESKEVLTGEVIRG